MHNTHILTICFACPTFKPSAKADVADDEDYDDDEELSTEELMGATSVFEEDAGFSVEDAE